MTTKSNSDRLESVAIPKLYVITRADLPPGAQAAQTLHAGVELCLKHHNHPAVQDWKETSNTVIVLAARNRNHLHEVTLRTTGRLDLGMPPDAWFHEPDLDNDLTAYAVVLQPVFQFVFEDLPLALRPERTNKRRFPWIWGRN